MTPFYGPAHVFRTSTPLDPQGPHSPAGHAWTAAVEELADTPAARARLTRGRTHARQGAVRHLTVRPGDIAATLQDGALERIVTIHITPLAPTAWTTLRALSDDRAHLYPAQTAQQVLHDLNTAARNSGIHLYPSASTVTAHCPCRHTHALCKHTAAALHHYAHCLDTEPLNLLLLRGLEPTAFFNSANTPPCSSRSPAAPVVDAHAVYTRSGPPAHLPAPPPPHHATTTKWRRFPGPEGLNPAAAILLVNEAGQRAHTLLHGRRSAGRNAR
ncbi:hypothetical protein ACGF7W_32220 [Streptomyces sp. NPDC048219]|uniref:hypothetical protein n=1 Tax=Streptomyces sp. NPDC048219 TaxID=3365517 RepID=UPI0037224C0F